MKLLKITATTRTLPEHHLVPVAVHAGDHDPLLHHREDQRAQRGADDGAVAPGEEAPADDRGDDRFELEAGAPERVRAVDLDDLEHRHEERGQGRRDEEGELHPADRDAHVPRRVYRAAGPEDPVPRPRPEEHPGRHHHEADPPDDRDGEVRSEELDPGAEEGAGEVVSGRPRRCRSAAFERSASAVTAIVRPRKMKSVPSVMMNDGSFVTFTSSPLIDPVSAVSKAAKPTAGQSGQPNPPASGGETRIMTAIPEKPRSDPIERSNSPAIIRSATAIARIPSGRCPVQDRRERRHAHEVVVGGDDREEDVHEHDPDQRAQLGTREEARCHAGRTDPLVGRLRRRFDFGGHASSWSLRSLRSRVSLERRALARDLAREGPAHPATAVRPRSSQRRPAPSPPSRSAGRSGARGPRSRAATRRSPGTS